MKWLKAETKKTMTHTDHELMARIKDLEHFVETTHTDLGTIKLNSAVCCSRLRNKTDPPPQKNPNAPILICTGDQLAEQVERLILTIGGAERELTTRLEVVS